MSNPEQAPARGSLEGRRVLVTGGTGFIGRHLVQRLVASGAQVRALVRPTSNCSVWGKVLDRIEVVRGDMRAPDSLEIAAKETQLIFHLAAATQGDWEQAEQATVLGTDCLLEKAKAAGVRHFIYISSMTVYDLSGLPPGAVVDENAPLEPAPQRRNTYARSKCEAEAMIRRHLPASPMAVTIVRPGAVYGPGGPPHIPPAIHVVADKFAFAIGGGRRQMPLVYVGDLVDALLQVADASIAAGKIYNIVCDAAVPEGVYVSEYLRGRGRRVLLLPLPKLPFLLAARLCDAAAHLRSRNMESDLLRSFRRVINPVSFSSAAIKRDLGWVARTELDQGIRASVGEVAGALC